MCLHRFRPTVKHLNFTSTLFSRKLVNLQNLGARENLVQVLSFQLNFRMHLNFMNLADSRIYVKTKCLRNVSVLQYVSTGGVSKIRARNAGQVNPDTRRV